MDTAEYMFQGGRYLYVVFMCHLSIEKALKGLYFEKLREIPPKVHNLVYLLKKIDIKRKYSACVEILPKTSVCKCLTVPQVFAIRPFSDT